MVKKRAETPGWGRDPMGVLDSGIFLTSEGQNGVALFIGAIVGGRMAAFNRLRDEILGFGLLQHQNACRGTMASATSSSVIWGIAEGALQS